MKKKACMECNYLAEDQTIECPNCSGKDFTKIWKGTMLVKTDETTQIKGFYKRRIKGNYAIILNQE